MRFDDVLGNEKLWAVIYDGEDDNILTKTFTNWLNPDYLHLFFSENSADLSK